MDNKKILEALKMQPLSEEEKAARHILGRLYGPIATCKESTRNGRLYNRTLWEKALKDEIFNEKVATKALFLELGHPADREETDMTKICACIPEVPKIVGDDLYAYVDILDTANGKILKTLCDYGFVPGISSRGSGDVMPNDEVDPETFFLETWDIVQLPAVKKARLSVCESLDKKNIKLKKALVESLNEANEEDKAIMKDTLRDLDIDIDETEETVDDIEIVITNEPSQIDAEAFAGDPSITLTEEAEDEETEEAEAEVEETPAEEEAPEEAVEETEETEEAEENEETPETMTIGEFLAALQDIEAETPVTVNSIELDGKTYETDIEFEIDDDGVKINVNCVAADEAETEEIETEEETTEETDDSTEEPETEEVDEKEEAVDDGDDEVVESIKELVRQKEGLEEEVKSLKKTYESEKAVGDAKVKELTEELEKYRASFTRVSAVASRNKKTVAGLQEQLNESATQITRLSEANTRLSEQLETKENKEITRLKENLSAVQKESTETTQALKEELTKVKKLANDRTNIAKSYKAKFNESVQRYINFRASILGVKSSEITNRLSEGYTFDDIDSVCEDLLTSSVNVSRLPVSGSKVTTRITESAQPKKSTQNDWGYDIDDSLLELAGLKK